MLKICPQCRDEFRATISDCPDCHVPLQFHDPNAPLPPADAGPPGLEEPVPVHRDSPWALEAVARQLQEEGIASQIDAFPPGSADGRSLALYVSESRAEAARAIVAAYTASRMPEHEGGDFGAVSTECPACSAALVGDATACAECGLEFPEA